MTQTAWCILEPNGKTLRVDSIREQKKECVGHFSSKPIWDWSWKDLQKMGYKCIKITISR